MQYFRRDASVRLGAWNLAWSVVFISSMLLICSNFITGEMFHRTKGIGWETPKDSPSLMAAQRANKLFPNRMRGGILMAIEALPGTQSVLNDTVAAFSRNVSERVKTDSRVKDYAPYVVGYHLGVPDRLKDIALSELVSRDKKMTVLMIQPTRMDGQSEHANEFLEEFCTSPPPGFTLHITGLLAVISGDGCFDSVHGHVNTRDMNFKILFRAELCTIPVALIIIAKLMKYYVKLLLVPILIVTVAFVVAAAMTIPWMSSIAIPNDGIAAMGSVLLAMGLDACLFFLTRFSEQHHQGMPLQQNVDTLVRHTGKTIAISATLISISFFASTMLPERNLQGTGVILGIAVIAGALTSICLIPASLLIAGPFFTGASVRTPVDIAMDGFNQREDLQEMAKQPIAKDKEDSHWLRMMRIIERRPWQIIGVVLFLLSPALFSVPHLRISGDRFALMPMGMPALRAMHHIEKHFPLGVLDPFAVVIRAPSDLGSSQLKDEVQDAFEGVSDADIMRLANRSLPLLGLNHKEALLLQDALRDIRNGKHVDMKSLVATVKKADCATLAAVSAGAASAVEKAHAATDASALRSAMRAANRSGCSSSDVHKAILATIFVLHSSKDGQIPKEAREPIKKEALHMGMSANEVAEIEAQTARGEQMSKEHQKLLVAVRSGAAAGLSKLKGHSHMDSLNDCLHTLKDSDLTINDAASVIGVVSAMEQESTHGISNSSEQLEAEARKRGADSQIAAIFAAVVTAMAREGVDLKRVARQGVDLKRGAQLQQGKHALAKPGLERSATGHEQKLDNSTKRGMKKSITGLHEIDSAIMAQSEPLDRNVHRRWSEILDIVTAAGDLVGKDHGTLLLPSGYKAMSDLCEALKKLGATASMLGPTWALHRHIDWPTAVATHLNADTSRLYQMILDSHVNRNHALLEIHTSFASLGSGGADFVVEARQILADWERAHPGFTAEISGGAAEAADTRSAVLSKMWSYLGISTLLIMMIVFLTFESIMVPIRLGFAVIFTVAATYGTAVLVYQTSLFHGVFPWLANFNGLPYEVIPMVTGTAIALGLDYDIFLVSRVFEYRLQGYSDRASVFRGATKAGGVISGAGIIMSLAFTGLCFSDKLIFQQFGVLLITSVLFDTFVVRTILVPALMLAAKERNWWPRKMPLVQYTSLEGNEADADHTGEVDRPYLSYLNRLTNTQADELESPLLGGI